MGRCISLRVGRGFDGIYFILAFIVALRPSAELAMTSSKLLTFSHGIMPLVVGLMIVYNNALSRTFSARFINHTMHQHFLSGHRPSSTRIHFVDGWWHTF